MTDASLLHQINWFHDADFDADEITFDDVSETLEIVFDQDVRQLPSDLPLPEVRGERRRWFGRQALVPYVGCRLIVRQAVGFSLEGGMTWGALDEAAYDRDRKELTIEAVFGPRIRIPVNALDVAVAFTGHVRCYKQLRTSSFGETISGRLDPTEVRD